MATNEASPFQPQVAQPTPSQPPVTTCQASPAKSQPPQAQAAANQTEFDGCE
jgi:hypothetical protein